MWEKKARGSGLKLKTSGLTPVTRGNEIGGTKRDI